MPADLAIWVIAGCATAGVILRPFGLPEAVYAAAGVVLLVLLGLISPAEMWRGVGNGADVYLFLAGMMLLAELAREQGLFDWLAAHAVRRAKGSARRLFWLVYAVGTVVTVFLSNDATAVVLTPAVAAAVKAARVADPLPYLLICAFVANAASFVLPISNPANLVIYHSQMPALPLWFARFLLPSALSVAATFMVLRWSQRAALRGLVAADVPLPRLSAGGKAAGVGILVTAGVLVLASVLGLKLGLPTAVAGAVTVAGVLAIKREAPWRILQNMSWGVLVLVAALFVLVEALRKSGLIGMISGLLRDHAAGGAAATAGGVILAVVSNLMNNLPTGLIAGTAAQAAHVSVKVTNALLIGVDLGPNLSVTGSLATILWLTALRREGLLVSGWTFFKLGMLVMPPALLLALLAASLM